MTNAIDLAYCAGLFDGEGCLSSAQYFDQQERDRYHCEIVLGMQDLATVEFFQRTVGVGNVHRRSDGMWIFQAGGAKAALVVKLLAPYLRTKREPALLFIEFAETFSAKNRKPLPVEIVATRRDLSSRIRQLMRVNSLDAATFASNGGK